MAASLFISYGIVFEAGFGDQAKRRQQQGVLQHPVTETVAAYLVALACSAAMLLFFRNLQTGDPWPMLIEHTVLLGLPAAVLALAGAIGWLWLQPRDPAQLNVGHPEVLRQVGGQRYVSAEVRNDGDETAEAVQVVAELSVDGEVVADGEQSVDFLSGGETQEIVFVFDTVAPDVRGRGETRSHKGAGQG